MNCSYCAVRIVRGPSRSRLLVQIRNEVNQLIGNGYREIVLTGIQLGAYGRDLEPRTSLTALLEELAPLPGLERLRLSSIEPGDITPDLIACMRQVPVICPHLHIPLQSGNNTVLQHMRRAYTAEMFCALIERLRAAIPAFEFTTDVIAGFPGETAAAFGDTAAVLTRTEPFKMHIFPFSARQGTDAAQLLHQTAGAVKKEREQVLVRLNEQLFRRVAGRYIGRRVAVLVEENAGQTCVQGYASHYMKVIVSAQSGTVGKIIPVIITEIGSDYLRGVIA